MTIDPKNENDAARAGDDDIKLFSPKQPDERGLAPSAADDDFESFIPPAPPQASPQGKPEFSVDYDFDREYRDVPTDAPLRIRRRKRKGCLSGVMLGVFCLAVGAILAALLWLAASDVLAFGKADSREQITIPYNYTISEVADLLYDHGLIKYTSMFKLYADFSNAEDTIAPGTYILNTNFDYRALVHGMTASGERVTLDVTFPEGLTMAQMFKKLEEAGVVSAQDLWDAAANTDFNYAFLAGAPATGDKHRLEGFLFPDTYTFYLGDSPTRVLRKMLDVFELRFNKDMLEKAEKLGYSVRDIVNIAAMIEREAGTDEDRPLIASVIYNRLNSDYTRLEIDATIYYAIAETGEAFSLNVDSLYNTYRHGGLPPGPIANPGLASINGALNPASTDYKFYALHVDGAHRFFATHEEQLAFINSDQYGG